MHTCARTRTHTHVRKRVSTHTKRMSAHTYTRMRFCKITSIFWSVALLAFPGTLPRTAPNLFSTQPVFPPSLDYVQLPGGAGRRSGRTIAEQIGAVLATAGCIAAASLFKEARKYKGQVKQLQVWEQQ